jgi:hypothetical protein
MMSPMGVPVVTCAPEASSTMTPGGDAHLVRLLPLRGEARLAGTALVEKALQVGFRQFDQGRAAVYNTADERPVALAEGGDAEQMPECVVRHDSPLEHPAKNWSGFSPGRRSAYANPPVFTR